MTPSKHGESGLKVEPTAIAGVLVITPARFEDERGFFSETYSQTAFAAAGLHVTFVQDNHSLSRRAGTIRGLHFQIPPAAQTKLVRVARGRIFVVAVDIRVGSPTFGRHVATDLSAENGRQLLVPTGFAHGYCTCEPDTEVLYKVTATYSAAHEGALAFDDPDLAIDWPIPSAQALTSGKDRRTPRLAQLESPFRFSE